jgi:ZIP family zinc transporter
MQGRVIPAKFDTGREANTPMVISGGFTTNDLVTAMLYATLAGVFIPLGGLLARIERIRPLWLERELRHGIIAFGGGALMAAVALVLVPEGQRHLSTWAALTAFGAGGVAFFLIDWMIERRGGGVAQLMAMLLDFLPETLALGAMLATNSQAGLLLAGLIALQNLPEGFNAYLELRARNALPPGRILAWFCLMVLLGPLAAWLGFSYLREMTGALGAIMMFAAGGILYLTFEDIAPQAHLPRRWAPALGAVAGFMLGLLGQMLLR